MASRTENRKTPRIQPYVAPCRIVDGNRRFAGYLTDLSAKGARVSCEEEPPRAGDRAILEIRFGKRVRYSKLVIEVKWVRQTASRHDFGLTFRSMHPQDRKILEAVVEEFKQRAARLA